jgi:Tn3 transposase DDE domain
LAADRRSLARSAPGGALDQGWHDLICPTASTLGSYSRRNRLYQAFRELGRVVRTIFLLEFLNDAKLREQITATTNKVEAYNGFAKWLNFGGEGVIDTIDPVEQEKHLKYNHLVANAAAIQNVIDLTRAVRDLQADGYFVRREDLAQLSPYQTRRLKRFGDYTLSMSSPDPFDTDLVCRSRSKTPRSQPPAPESLFPIFGRI